MAEMFLAIMRHCGSSRVVIKYDGIDFAVLGIAKYVVTFPSVVKNGGTDFYGSR